MAGNTTSMGRGEVDETRAEAYYAYVHALMSRPEDPIVLALRDGERDGALLYKDRRKLEAKVEANHKAKYAFKRQLKGSILDDGSAVEIPSRIWTAFACSLFIQAFVAIAFLQGGASMRDTITYYSDQMKDIENSIGVAATAFQAGVYFFPLWTMCHCHKILTTDLLPLTTYRLPLTAYHLPLTTYYHLPILLVTADYLPRARTTYYILLATCYLLLRLAPPRLLLTRTSPNPHLSSPAYTLACTSGSQLSRASHLLGGRGPSSGSSLR